MENIWTRERKLNDSLDENMAAMRKTYKSLKRFLAFRDWDSVAGTALMLSKMAEQASLTERELEGVSELVEGFERVCKRMEELEKQAHRHWREE